MINKISETTKQNTIRKSVKNVPTQPSAVGITEQQLKDRFVGIVTDPTNSAFAEIDRIVDEANAELQARDNAFNEHINNAEIHKPNVIEKILVNGIEKQPDVEKAVNITAEDLGAGAPNGLAQLDANQKLLVSQLPPDGINRIERILVNNVEKAPYTDEVTGEKTVNITAEDVGAGKPNGLATLDENQKLRTEQLPEGINIYEYYDSFEEFPETGESGVTYVDRSTNNVYLWTGSDYTNITAQLALGETSNTAYRGDRGKIAYDHSQSTGNPHQTAFDEILDKPTTLEGYGITDALKKGDQSKVVNDAFTTRITATNDVEIIDSPVSLKTAVIKSIKGLSIKAIQKRGDFRTGALDYWSANAGYALSISNNILTVTVNTDTPGQVVLTNNVEGQALPDRAYFIMCYIKTIAATSVQVGFSDGVKSVAKTTEANRWTYVSSKLSTNALSSPQIIIDCSSMTTGDSFQVCLFEVIDLIDSGIQDWTNEKLDATIPLLEYFEGVRHSNPTQLKSIGDNLIKLEPKTITNSGVTMTVNADYTITLNGTTVASAVFYIIGSLNGNIILKYPVTDLQLIIEHISGEFTGGLDFWGDGRLVNDGTVVYGEQLRCVIPAGSAGRVYKSVLYRNRAGYLHSIRFYAGAGLTFNEATFRIMLVHKDNPLTEYKPYTEHVLELPQYTLRSLPDGTADEITPTHYIQRIDPETMTALEEPIYTPIEWDNTYPAWNYGLEQVFADGNPTIAQMEIEYPLDLQKQVDTNTWIAQRNEGRIAQNEADINTLQSSIGAGIDHKLDKSGHPANKVLVTNSNGEITTTTAAANQVVLGDGTGRSITTSVTSGSSSLVTSGAVHAAIQAVKNISTATISSSLSLSVATVKRQVNFVIGRIVLPNGSSGVSVNTAFATIPSGYRPSSTQVFYAKIQLRYLQGSSYTTKLSYATLTINTSGVMTFSDYEYIPGAATGFDITFAYEV